MKGLTYIALIIVTEVSDLHVPIYMKLIYPQGEIGKVIKNDPSGPEF